MSVLLYKNKNLTYNIIRKANNIYRAFCEQYAFDHNRSTRTVQNFKNITNRYMKIDALKADIESAMRSISAVNTQTTDLINSHIAKLNAAIAAAEKAATDADTALKAALEDRT